ncbi:MAG: SLC13 family permease [Pirellulales bacterium]|nr:SLC13 family permease [Pirellulales bacterium]
MNSIIFLQINFDGWVSLAVAAGVFVALQVWRGAPSDLLFLGALVAVTITGVITPEQAAAGFANTAVLTIGSLFIVAGALRATGVLDWVGHLLLGKLNDERSALGRLTTSVVAASAFVINTPLVAMLAPVVVDWCRKRQVSPSRLLMPLSYLAILGGVCTLIGTSTTLIINGLLKDAYTSGGPQITDPAKAKAFVEELRPMWFFEIGYVGAPCAIAGALVIYFITRRLLPNRTDMVEQLGENRREYLVEMLVQPQCRLIGQTIEAAGLRNLPGLFLIEIDREGELITPVTPQDVIHAGDRLVFTGIVTTIADLERIPGLVPAADATYELSPQQRQERHLTEVVLSRTSPLIGNTVREADFRRRYNAAIVAVHRNGVRLTNKIGSIQLEAGDTLLLQTRTDFVSHFRHNRDFFLVSSVEGTQSGRHDRAIPAALLFGVLIVWMTFSSWSPWPGFSSPAIAGIDIAGLMVVARCITISEARRSIDLHVLLTIAGALALGRALTESGAAAAVANALVALVGDHPLLLLIVVYLLAVVFTELISNNAVAVMLFPLAVAIAASGGYSPRPFIMAIALAASLSFLTPIGYQTNLMVMGPGGYRPRDYLRAGWPVALVVAVTAIALIPVVWPFEL